MPNWNQNGLFIWEGKKKRDVLSSPVQTNGLSSSLLFHVMGDNLYSSKKTSESVPGKLLGHFVLIYTYSTGVAVFDVIIF